MDAPTLPARPSRDAIHAALRDIDPAGASRNLGRSSFYTMASTSLGGAGGGDLGRRDPDASRSTSLDSTALTSHSSGSFGSVGATSSAARHAPVLFEGDLVVERPVDFKKSLSKIVGTSVPRERRQCIVTATMLTVVRRPKGNKASKVKAQLALAGATIVSLKATAFEVWSANEGTAHTFVAASIDEKAAWLRILAEVTAAAAFEQNARPLMWSHRIVRGTLHATALLGDPIELDKWLQGQPDMLPQAQLTHAAAQRDDEGYLPIHCAVASGKADGVEWLAHKAGSDVNVVSATGRSPLHLACELSYRDVVEKLLALGAKPNLRVPCSRPYPVDWCLAITDNATMAAVLLALLDHGAREHLVTLTPAIRERLEHLTGPDAASTDFRKLDGEEPLLSFAAWFQRLGPLAQIIPQLRQVQLHYAAKSVTLDRDKWPADVVSRLADKSSWLPDEAADTCTICKDAFSLYNRKHHCRWCKALVCGACSAKGIWCGSLFEGSLRLCDGCFNLFYAKYGEPTNTARTTTTPAANQQDDRKDRRMSLYNDISSAQPGPPDSGAVPKGPVVSPEKPFANQIADKFVSLGVGRLFDLLFSDNHEWRSTFHQTRGDKDLIISKWSGEPSMRSIKYSTPNQSKLVNATHLPVEERQTLRLRQNKQAYVVDVVLSASGVPYSDCFIVSVRYIFTHEQKGVARINVSLAIEWRKSTMMKDLILRAASSVSRNYMRAVFTVLKDVKVK